MAERLAEDMADGGGDLASGALQRGMRLGRYELVLPIAVGGMARVWAARMNGQRGFTKLVAIKTILPHLASDPDFEHMFLDEARIASGVHHPNVCEVYELGEERGVLYLAMEWVNGDTLSHVLRVAGQVVPLDPRIAGRIVADACAGLHAAHALSDDEGQSLNVVHRDVSPQNILLSADGNVKVADFGVAKALGQRHHHSSAGGLKGKLSYMAPEQATGKPVDRRSDVFSLGCVLYEMATGKKPFRGDGEHHVLHRIQKGEFVPPSRTLTGFPYELERIILRAMSPQPLHRYQAMDGMRLALEEWLARSGPVVTQSHVAAVVRQRAGAEMDQRKERIRLAYAAPSADGHGVASGASAAKDANDALQATPSRPTATASLSGVVPLREAGDAGGIARETRGSVPPPASLPAGPLASAPREVTVTDYVTAAALGVLGAAAMGALALVVWRSLAAATAMPAPTRASVSDAALVAQASAPRASIAPAGVAEGAVAGDARTTAEAGAASVRLRTVTFRVLPESAILVVDGAPLASGARSVERPATGKTLAIVVRAPGFTDESLTLDPAAPESVDVWLTEKKKAATPGRAHEGSGEGSGATPARPPDTLPANPY
jgi:hypothetical protein